MKCPYCNQEHPDNTLYCPQTGRKIQDEKLACTENPHCPIYGKFILPTGSRFCPECGSPIKQRVTPRERQTGNGNNSSSATLNFNVNGVTFNMIKIEAGSFMMGDDTYPDSSLSYPSHKAVVSDIFYLGETLVTQDRWISVMGNNPSRFIGNLRPVEQISWYECRLFIKKLNEILYTELNGKTFRFPTEIEWEYAARGGDISLHTIYPGSDNKDDVAWYGEENTHNVKLKCENELGLYDMSGNVAQWCYDWFDYFEGNCRVIEKEKYKVFRGGVETTFASYDAVTVFSRNGSFPTTKKWSIGLRLCLSE